MTEPTSTYRYSHTIPWSRAELLQVDGFRLVYSHDKERGLIVHLPGCREATLQELRDEGRTIVMPETPRSKRTMVA